jgi:hypothetical protein
MRIIPQRPYNKVRSVRLSILRETLIEEKCHYQISSQRRKSCQGCGRPTSAVLSRNQIEPIRGLVSDPIVEVPDRPSRVIQPSPCPDSTLSRQRERQVVGSGDFDFGIYESGICQ